MTSCAACQGRLELEIQSHENALDEQNDGEFSFGQEQTAVPDDVELNCGCHFHWQCLLDSYEIAKCPSCDKCIAAVPVSGGEIQILCNLSNEGGLQQNLDILPISMEENYLKTHPEERRCRAFLEFCKEGDVEAIVDLLNDDEEADNDSNQSHPTPSDVLRYQDPTGSMQSALHIAVMQGNVEVIWLLLLVASTLDLQVFPVGVLQAAEQLGIEREDQNERSDIRLLKDANGMTAETYADGQLWGTSFSVRYLSMTLRSHHQ